ncbi:MAG: hypothetical protein HY921_11065 [Elusimicrobia bacterium]|nr:hypothetical protein [Elusimicrobiota bacterium]
MQEKISLLMEETGCDRGQAELALEMCGYVVEEAIKAIPRLIKNIVVVKGKFAHHGESQYGLILGILNVKSNVLMRCRAVLSFNPAVYTASIGQNWFEFEKQLYGCRLWEGSLPAESLEMEQRLSHYFRKALEIHGAELAWTAEDALEAEVLAVFQSFFRSSDLRLSMKREILNLGQFQSLRNDPEGLRRPQPRSQPRAEYLLILKIALEEDGQGTAAADLRAGDTVMARIDDSRDIAQYLGKLFGGISEKGPIPILVPVEALEATEAGILARVRFSLGVCGDVELKRDCRLKVLHNTLHRQKTDTLPWWRRFFQG